jgi:transposase
MSRKVIFKTYNQDQLSLLPPSYDDLVPEHHPVRIVNTIIDHVDISALEKSYKGGAPQAIIHVCYSRLLYMPIYVIYILQEK